jgi:hypothetical protein
MILGAQMAAKILTDADLLKRARYGGRNLTGLAILATLLAVLALLAMLAFAGEEAVWIAVPVLILAISYWLLAIAARRGSAQAINIVRGFLAIQFVLSLIGQIVLLLRSKGAAPLNLLLIVIPLLVIVAISRNRNDLIELQNRGLWNSVFEPAAPTRRLCFIGGLLMFVGLVALYVGLIFGGIQAANDIRLRQDFVGLVKNDEKNLFDSFAEVGRSASKESWNSLLQKADALQEKAQNLAQRATASSKMNSIAQSYLEAVN